MADDRDGCLLFRRVIIPLIPRVGKVAYGLAGFGLEEDADAAFAALGCG